MLLMTGCATHPADPGEGEMTGVIVSTNDVCCWPDGGAVDSPHYEVVALLPPDYFVRIWNAQHPDDSRGPITPDDWRAGASRLQVPVERFTEEADPGDQPLYGDVVEGRWRVPFDGDPAMVCVGYRGHEYEWVYENGRGHEKRTGDQEYLFLTCGLVDEPAPVGVTVSVHFGGIDVSTA
jgi:hypothetical protein